MALIGQRERTGAAPLTSPLPWLGSVKAGSAASGTNRQKGRFLDHDARPLMSEAAGIGALGDNRERVATPE